MTTVRLFDKEYVSRMAKRAERVSVKSGEHFSRLHSDWNQIWHFFYLLQVRRRPIRCFYGEQVYEAVVTEVRDKVVILHIKGFHTQSLPSFEIEFLHSDSIYKFEVIIAAVAQEYVCIYIPDHLHSRIRRKDPRIAIDDLFIRFTLSYPPFPQTPFSGVHATDRRLHTTYFSIVQELEKDDPNLKLIYLMITDNFKGQGLELCFTSHTQDHVPGSSKTDIVMDTIKTFFISDTRNISSYYTPHKTESLTNLCEIYETLKRSSLAEAKDYCQKVQQEDIQQFLSSYARTPILIFASVIGHLSLVSTIFDQKPVAESEAMQLDLLARFLSYAISKSAISKNYYHQARTRVLNISKGGLLFEIENKPLLDYLVSQNYLKILIEIGKNTLKIKARIIQHSSLDPGRYGLSVEFYKVGADVDMLLEKLIYQRKLEKIDRDLD